MADPLRVQASNPAEGHEESAPKEAGPDSLQADDAAVAPEIREFLVSQGLGDVLRAGAGEGVEGAPVQTDMPSSPAALEGHLLPLSSGEDDDTNAYMLEVHPKHATLSLPMQAPAPDHVLQCLGCT